MSWLQAGSRLSFILFVLCILLHCDFRLQVMLQTIDNAEPEERQELKFRVISVSPGATVSADDAEATIVLAASDFPLGLFEFQSDAAGAVTEACSFTFHILNSIAINIATY